MNKLIRILYVDDNPLDRELVRDALKEHGGFKLTQAASRADFEAALAKGGFDLVLSDFNILGFQGLQVLDAVKAKDATLPVIIVTGTGSEEIALEAMQRGAAEYVIKTPTHIRRLPKTIQSALEKKRLEEERQQIEKALKVSEEHYRDLVENSQDMICTHDLQGNLLFVNEAGTKISGYSNATLLKMNLRDILAPEVRDRFDAYLAEIQTEGQARGLMRIQTADGEIHILEFNNTLQAEALAAPFVYSVARDVTKRVRAEVALRESEARYRTLVELSPDGIGIHCEGKVVYVNAATVKLFHADRPEDLIGLPVIQLVHPDYRAIAMQRVRRSYENHLPASLLEEKFVTLDGQPIDVEVAAAPIAYEGKPATQIIIRDISERKLAEDAKRQAEIRYRSLFEQTHDAIFILDLEGRHLDANPRAAEMLGYTHDEILKLSFKDVSVQLPESQQVMKRLLAGEHVPLYERIFRKKNGDLVPVEINVELVRGADGQPLHIQSVVRDVTARKLAEKELAASEAELRALFASMQDVVLVIDRDGVYRKIAPTNPALLIKPPEELLGKNLRDVFPVEQAETFLGTVRQVLETRETARIEYQLKIGEREVWFSTSISPMDNDNTLWVARDITERKQAEEQMHLLATGLEAAATGIAITNKNGAIEWVNPAWSTLTGYSKKEVIGKNPRVLKSGKQPNEFYKNLWATILSGEVWRGELINKRKDGTLYAEEETITPVLDKNGAVTHFIAIKQDITERKENEKALEASKERYRALTQTASDAIVSADSAGNIVSWNQGAEQLFGYTEIEISGQPLTLLLPERYRAAHLEGMARVQSGGEKHIIGKSIEAGGLRKDGSEFPVEFSLSEWQVDEGHFYTAIIHDITKRAQAEEEIRRRAAEFAALYESSQALAGNISLEDVLKDITESARRLFGITGVGMYLYDPASKILEIKVFTHPSIPIGTRLSLGEGLAGKVAQTRQTMRIDDYMTWEGRSSKYEGIPIRATLETPMIYQDELIGVLVMHEAGDSQRKFTEADERLLSLFAAQTAAAIQNARLFEEVRQRVTELEALNRLSTATRTITQPTELLAASLEETLAVLHIETGSINLLDETSGKLAQTVARGWLAETQETPQSPDEGIFGRVFTSGHNYVTPNFVADPLARPEAVHKFPPGWGGACVPIRSPQKILGVLLVAAPGERTFAPNEIRLLDTIAEITGNALYRAQLHQQTERRLQNLQALRKIDRAISSSFNMRPGLQTILIYSLSQLGVDAAAVLLFHPALQTLEYESGQGFYTRAIERTLVRLGDGHAGRAALEGHTTYLTNLNEASADFTRASLLAGEHFIGYCVVPLISKGEIRGVLEVFSRAELHPSPDWLNFLETLAGQTAIAIDNAQLFENLQRSNLEISLAYDATIEGWSRALELRDEETEGHTQRVTDLAMNLAKRCKLSEQEMLHLRRGALLHDIGKIGVPDSILLKPGPLNDEERRIMQSHVQLAYEMLLPIEYLHPALDIPYCHHEKWDGSGYPRGLKGQEIPIAARIFAVADVWDALTSDRPYRPAWTKENTLEYLRAQSGKHFDPQVLEKFMEILEKKKGSPILHGDVSEKEKGQ